MSPPAGLSRRRLLQAGALAVLACGGSGCGNDEVAASRETDAAVLAELHRHEAAAVAALAAAAAAADGAARAELAVLLRRARRRVARLAALLEARGGVARRARSPGPGPPLPAALARAEDALAAHAGALARLGEADLRAAALDLLAGQAEHAAVLRVLGGGAPAPDAFAGLV